LTTHPLPSLVHQQVLHSPLTLTAHTLTPQANAQLITFLSMGVESSLLLPVLLFQLMDYLPLPSSSSSPYPPPPCVPVQCVRVVHACLCVE
jgi:hypothetical protein